MTKRSKIIFGIILFVLGFVVQIIGAICLSKFDSDFSIVVSMSSAVPLGTSILIFSSLVPKKYNIIKYLMMFYAIGALAMFIIICIIACTSGFVYNDGGYYTPK